MSKFHLAASAALAVLAAPLTSTAAVYTGVLDGENFYIELPVPQFETRPLRFEFKADLTQIDGAFLSISYLVGFYGSDDMGPGQPRSTYADSYDIWEDASSALTPTGFSFVIDTDDNATCSEFKPPYYCDFSYVFALTLDGSALSGPVEYSYRVTAVPEPTTWTLMIGGFGLAVRCCVGEWRSDDTASRRGSPVAANTGVFGLDADPG